jgi:methyl-accepting chemotaxis protein
MTLKRKLLALVILPVLTCTTIAVLISSLKIRNQGIEGLEDKSLAILALNIQEYLVHHEDYTSVVEMQNKDDLSKIDNTATQNYKFRISSPKPENLKHLSTAKESQFISQFEKERLNQLTYIDKATDSLWVMRPVFMDKSKGCLECHVLKAGESGLNSENSLRGIFIVKSSMKGANAQVQSAIFQLGLLGFVIMVIAIFVVYIVIVKILSIFIQITSSLNRLANGEISDDLMINVNTGDEIEQMSKALNISVEGLNNKTVSAINIGKGNYDTDIALLSDKDLLGKSLVDMRDSLKTARLEEEKRKAEDQKRIWANEGFAKFADILRQNNNDFQLLCDNVIINVVKYLNANQGGIFLWNEDDKEDKHFELISAYAWDRKKFITKRIDEGEGLVGACAMEKETIFLIDVPDDYVAISSGLGKAKPKCVILTPLKSEERVLGVIEMASFNVFEKHQIDFLESIAESIASTISSVRVNARTKSLLEQSQQQAEEMAAQEEEMRQNMEELQATQEEAARKSGEIEGLITSLNSASYMVEYDLNGIIININDAYLHRIGLTRNQVIGSHHSGNIEMTKKQKEDYGRFWDDLRSGKSKKTKTKISWDGKTATLIETYFPVANGDGVICKVMKLAHELEEFKD